MMKKIIVALILLATLLLIGFTAKQDSKKDKGANKEVIKIGVIAPLTGDFGAYGQEVLAGVQDAVGDKYQIIAEDDLCEPAKAVSEFKKLTEVDNVKFIVGPACGSPQEAIAPLVKDKDVVVILSSAASRNLFEIGGKKIFNTQYSLEEEAKFVAEKMNEAGYKNVGLVTYNNAFSLTHSKSFKENFKGSIVELNYTDFNSDIVPEITKNKSSKIDAFFVTDLSFFFNRGVERLKQNGLNVPVYSQYAVELPAAIPFVEGVIYSFPSDVLGNRGAVYELSKIAGQIIAEQSEKCDGEAKCVQENLIETGLPQVNKCGTDEKCINENLSQFGEFDQFGVRKQGMVLKQIVNGVAKNF